MTDRAEKSYTAITTTNGHRILAKGRIAAGCPKNCPFPWGIWVPCDKIARLNRRCDIGLSRLLLGCFASQICGRLLLPTSALGVLADYALYKSTHSLTHSRNIGNNRRPHICYAKQPSNKRLRPTSHLRFNRAILSQGSARLYRATNTASAPLFPFHDLPSHSSKMVKLFHI